MRIHLIGGTYKERCFWPVHNKLLGSAGRAAKCLAELGSEIEVLLNATVDSDGELELKEEFALNSNVQIRFNHCDQTTSFDYFHPLSEPVITPPVKVIVPKVSVDVDKADTAVVFGMIEATPVVDCETVMYDPQNTYKPILFSVSGSKAKQLHYVTNSNELSIFYMEKHSKEASVETMSAWLLNYEKADSVFVKCGQRGVYVKTDQEEGWIAPYKTQKVFPIGSGDSYVASLAYYLFIRKLPTLRAAKSASIATAHYVSNQIMNNDQGFEAFAQRLEPVVTHKSKHKVYLAGPFFTLSQQWMVNEAKKQISAFGMDVFSPYHEIGIGSVDQVVQKDLEAIKECDLLYALFDGTDPGTLFEIGYARSIGIPVIILAENPKDEELKMYVGSGCAIFDDFATSIYHLAWTG